MSVMLGEKPLNPLSMIRMHEDSKPQAVRKEWIEDEVIKGLTIILNDDATLSAMADKLLELFEEDNVVLPALEAQLKDVQKSIVNLIKAVEQGLVTRSTKARLEELEAEEEMLKESIFIEQNKVPRLSKEQILCVLERFRDLDLSIERNRERLVDALVKCIVLYDDKLIITVTFRDEPIVIMTSEEVADVARLGSDINSLAPPLTRTSSVKLTETPPYQVLLGKAVFNVVLATIAMEICFMREFWGF